MFNVPGIMAEAVEILSVGADHTVPLGHPVAQASDILSVTGEYSFVENKTKAPGSPLDTTSESPVRGNYPLSNWVVNWNQGGRAPAVGSSYSLKVWCAKAVTVSRAGTLDSFGETYMIPQIDCDAVIWFENSTRKIAKLGVDFTWKTDADTGLLTPNFTSSNKPVQTRFVVAPTGVPDPSWEAGTYVTVYPAIGMLAWTFGTAAQVEVSRAYYGRGLDWDLQTDDNGCNPQIKWTTAAPATWPQQLTDGTQVYLENVAWKVENDVFSWLIPQPAGTLAGANFRALTYSFSYKFEQVLSGIVHQASGIDPITVTDFYRAVEIVDTGYAPDTDFMVYATKIKPGVPTGTPYTFVGVKRRKFSENSGWALSDGNLVMSDNVPIGSAVTVDYQYKVRGAIN